MDTSSAVVSTPFNEPKDSGKLSDQVIDLNKTPQQKQPKRKKHRPKVVKEGKQTKTPKTATAKMADPKEKTTEKRKYVRKKDSKESITQHPDSVGETSNLEKNLKKRKYVQNDLQELATLNADDIGETADPTSGTAATSCRRALNFEKLENIREGKRNSFAQQEMLNKKGSCNSGKSFQAADSINKTNMKFRTKSDLQMRQDGETLLENHHSRATHNLASSSNQFLCNDNTISNRIGARAIPKSDRREAAVQLASTKEVQIGNSNVNAKATDIRMQHPCAEGIDQISFPANIICKNLERTRQKMPQNTQSVAEISQHLIDGRGYKKEFGHFEQTSHCTANPPDYQLYSCIKSNAICADTQKKRKIENGILTNINGLLPSDAAVNHSMLNISSRKNLHTTESTAYRNRETWNSHTESYNFRTKENNGSTRFPVDLYIHQVASGQDVSKQPVLSGSTACMEKIEDTKRSMNIQNLAALATVENFNMLPPSPQKTGPQPVDQLHPKTSNINVSIKQAVGSSQSKSVPFREGKMRKIRMDILQDHQSPAKRRGILHITKSSAKL